MKKSLCITIFLAILLMIGAYTVQAQVNLTSFDGLWLQDSTKFRNMVNAGIDGSNIVPTKGGNESYKSYVCMEVEPGAPDTIKLRSYDRRGNYTDIYGNLYWLSGTNSNFFGYVEFFSEDGYEYDFAYVTVINNKFTSVPGYGTYSDPTGFDAWNFLWSAKIPKKVPYDIWITPCGVLD